MKIGNSKVDFKGLLIDGPMGCQSIEPKIMELLRVLVDNANQVMTREDLITAVWGVEYGGDERLSRGISILRKALGDKRGQHTHIVTISRVGYRLIADVSEDDSSNVVQRMELDSTVSSQSDDNFISTHSTRVEALTQSPEVSDVFKVPSFSGKRFATVTTLIIACVMIGVFALFGLRTNETLSLQAKMERGFLHIENFTPKGAISEAQEIFSGILADDPDHAAARAGLAFAVFREYTHLERDPAILQRATAHAEAALRADEHLGLANIAVAWASAHEGNFDRAHEYLDRAEILDAENIFILEGRYRAFVGQGQFEKVEKTINAAIQAYPDYALFYALRGTYFSNVEDDFPKAEVAFKKAIELAPDNPRVYAGLAHSLHS